MFCFFWWVGLVFVVVMGFGILGDFIDFGVDFSLYGKMFGNKDKKNLKKKKMLFL